MGGKPRPSHEDLIDYLVEQMPAEDARAWEAVARADEQIAGLVTAGRTALAPLDAWTAPPPPSALVDEVMAQVTATAPLGVRGGGRDGDGPLTGETAPRPRGILSLGETIAIAASIALIITFSVPGMANLRARQLQARCGTNLASLVGGLAAYAKIFDGAIPAVVTGPNTNWLRHKNIHHMEPALRVGVVRLSQLTCPTGRAAPREVDDYPIFLDQAQVTFYSAQNANGPVLRLEARIKVPLVSDPSPMIVNGRIYADKAGRSNSPAHAGRGQNVAMPDGSVRFLTSPIFDERDNIWQAEHVERYTGIETQLSATDAFLIP